MPQDLAATFLLHSKPGGTKVMYLDFDGVAGSFSDTEKQRIQRIWARVADDFAPFDVDVTTQDPGLDALRKANGSDANYGVRVVIYDTNWFNPGAAGVAYVGSFNWASDTPAFVFADQLGGGGEKFVAEAASHEPGPTNIGRPGAVAE